MCPYMVVKGQLLKAKWALGREEGFIPLWGEWRSGLTPVAGQTCLEHSGVCRGDLCPAPEEAATGGGGTGWLAQGDPQRGPGLGAARWALVPGAGCSSPAVPSHHGPPPGECGQGSAATAMLGIKERTRGTSGSGAWRQTPRSCLGAKVLAGQTGLHLKHWGGEAWELPGPPAQQSPSDATLGFLSSILVASVSLIPPLCLAGHLLPLPHPPRGSLGWPSATAGCPPRAFCAALSPSHQLPATPQTGRGRGNGRMKSTGDRAEVGRAGW